MKIVGLIAEYNPFHNGHQYHIAQAKALTQADAVVVVMSGDFVQRGEPAIMPKHLRAEAALKAGASLVIELPVCYATGSAEQFAFGAISILEKLGCVNAVCFGSECGNLASLRKIARILADEPDEFKTALQSLLRKGVSFPAARQTALQQVYPDLHLSELLEQPNNILGIEYLKALYRLKSPISPITIQRKVSDYRDEHLRENYSSASAIRNAIATNSLSDITNQVPNTCFELLEVNFRKQYPIFLNDFSILLKYRLLNESKLSLTEYLDVSEELANRIYNHRNDFLSFEQFCELLKTKEITYSRISRALLHILLKIKKIDCTEIAYARVLGFRKDQADLMSEFKKNSTIPLVTKLSASDHPMLDMDIYASHLYSSIITEKYKTPFLNEYEHPIVRI